MKRFLAILLILIQAGIPMFAQQLYEGITVQGESGEFPSEGYYAASNTFARNSLVELRNPTTGASIQVIIVNRVSDPGIFLILSDEAAQVLGVSRDNPRSLVATPVSVPGLTSVNTVDDVPFSTDPEQNPGAEFADPNEFVYIPGSDIPVVDNPLLQPTENEVASNSGEDEPPLIANPVEINDGVVLEETLDPEDIPELPVILESEEIAQVPETQTEETTQAEHTQNIEPEPEPEPESEPAITSTENEPENPLLTSRPEPETDNQVESEFPEPETAETSDIPDQQVSQGTRSGLSRGLTEITNDGINASQPLPGSRAQRDSQLAQTPRSYSKGILSALNNIQRGSNAVSPDFLIQEPDYVFWPPEYDAENFEVDSTPEPVVEDLPSEDLTEESETEVAVDPVEDVVAEVEEPVVEVVTEPTVDPTIVDSTIETDVETESNEDPRGEYAQALAENPEEAWLQRIRDQYPDRELFLPPVQSDLDSPLPVAESAGTSLPDVALNEVSSPIAEDVGPEFPLNFESAITEDELDNDVPEVGFNFENELPSAILPVAPEPGADSSPRSAGLPEPLTAASEDVAVETTNEEPTEEIEAPQVDAPLEDSLDSDSLRLASPLTEAPSVAGIPLAQYNDPRPGVGINRISAIPENLSTVDVSSADPRVPNQENAESPLPLADPVDGEFPAIGHEPSGRARGIEAGILRLGPGREEVTGDLPEPVEGRVAEATDSEEAIEEVVDNGPPEASLERSALGDVDITLEEAEFRSPELIEPVDGIDRPLAEATDSEEAIEEIVEEVVDNGPPEASLERSALGDVDITLEEAEFRSPELIEPVDGIDRPLAEDSNLPGGFVLYTPDDVESLAGPEDSLSPPAVEDRELDSDVALTEPGSVEESTEPQEVEAPVEVVDDPAELPEDESELLVYLEESEERVPEDTDPVVESVEIVPDATSPIPPDARWAADNLPLVYNLQSGGYYLQVGAFNNPRSAKRVVEEVSPGYPMAVLPITREANQVYRVFVGPLSEDEKGTVLYWFRARGYRDAFIRKGS